jgi:hypothetical protein
MLLQVRSLVLTSSIYRTNFALKNSRYKNDTEVSLLLQDLIIAVDRSANFCCAQQQSHLVDTSRIKPKPTSLLHPANKPHTVTPELRIENADLHVPADGSRAHEEAEA